MVDAASGNNESFDQILSMQLGMLEEAAAGVLPNRPNNNNRRLYRCDLHQARVLHELFRSCVPCSRTRPRGATSTGFCPLTTSGRARPTSTSSFSSSSVIPPRGVGMTGTVPADRAHHLEIGT